MFCPNCEKEIKEKNAQCSYCGCRFPVKESQEEFSKKQETQIHIVLPIVEDTQKKDTSLQAIEKQEVVVQEVSEIKIKHIKENMPQETYIKLCEDCSKQISPSAKFCKYCGKPISDIQEQTLEVPPINEITSINEKEQGNIVSSQMEEEQKEDTQPDKPEEEFVHVEEIAPQETDTKFCKNCGKMIASTAVFCKYCGIQLTK